MGFYEDMLANGAIVEPPIMLPKTRKRQSAGGTVTQTVHPGQSDSSSVPTTARGKADYFTQQGLNAYAAEPDVSGLQQYAQTRAADGDQSMLNALAAQFAGERFEPVQGQYLKRALAAQEPLKVGNSGYITPTGQYVKDPTFMQDRQAEKLLQMGQMYSAQAQREEQAAADRDMRLAVAGMRAGGADGANDARVWRAEDKLRNDFDALTKDERTTLGETNKILSVLNSGQTTGISQQAVAILLQKFLDPTSVVREAEYARAAEAQGLVGRVQSIISNAKNGQFLTAQTQADIKRLADLYKDAATQKLRRVARQYEEIARRRGLDSASVIADQTLRSVGTPDDPLGLRAR